MGKEKLNQILENHKLWIETNGEEGQRADLHRAYLDGADLRGADLDYSSFPLWCGGLDIHIDDRQAIQLLYHLTRNVLYSKNTSDEIKRLFNLKTIIDIANMFHRVKECGRIKSWKD